MSIIVISTVFLLLEAVLFSRMVSQGTLPWRSMALAFTLAPALSSAILAVTGDLDTPSFVFTAALSIAFTLTMDALVRLRRGY